MVILLLLTPKQTPKIFIQIRVNPRNLVKLFIAHELDTWLRDLSTDLSTLGNFLFGAIKVNKNADPDKCSYSGYGIESDCCSLFSLQNDWGKNVVIFELGNSSSMHIYKKKKHILILGVSPTQRLDDTTVTTEAKYFINFSRTRRKFCLSIHYNGRNSVLFVNASKIYQFKVKDCEINLYPLCLGNVSKDFSIIILKIRIKWIYV